MDEEITKMNGVDPWSAPHSNPINLIIMIKEISFGLMQIKAGVGMTSLHPFAATTKFDQMLEYCGSGPARQWASNVCITTFLGGAKGIRWTRYTLISRMMDDFNFCGTWLAYFSRFCIRYRHDLVEQRSEIHDMRPA